MDKLTWFLRPIQTNKIKLYEIRIPHKYWFEYSPLQISQLTTSVCLSQQRLVINSQQLEKVMSQLPSFPNNSTHIKISIMNNE